MKKIFIILVIISVNLFAQFTYTDSTFEGRRYGLLDTGNGFTIDTSKNYSLAFGKNCSINWMNFYNSNYTNPEDLVDGDSSTFVIFSSHNILSEILIDLDESIEINQIKFHTAYHIPHINTRGYKMYIGNDISSMNLFIERSGLTSQPILTENFTPVSTRYIKIVLTEFDSAYATSLSEIEVFGPIQTKSAYYYSDIVTVKSFTNLSLFSISGSNLEGQVFYRIQSGLNSKINSSWTKISDYIPVSSLYSGVLKPFLRIQIKLVSNGSVLPVINKISLNSENTVSQPIHYLGPEDLLSQTSYISAGTIDNENNLWASVRSGPGYIYNLIKINPTDFNASIVTQIGSANSIAASQDNKIFLFDYAGLKYVENSILHNVDYNFGTPITDGMVFDSFDNLWVAVRDSGVAMYDGNNWTYYTSENTGLPLNKITCIESDYTGKIWIGTQESGLFKYDLWNGTWEKYIALTSELPADHIEYLKTSPSGLLFVRSSDMNTFASTFDGTTWTDFTNLFNGVYYKFAAIDHNDNFWFTNGESIYYYDNDSFREFNRSNSFLMNSINYFELDKNDNLWTGAYSGYSSYDSIYTYYLGDNFLTDVKTNSHKIIPENLILNQNYPNPFNPSTTISYSLPSSGFASIKVYDILGKEITTLVNDNKTVGNYTVNFNKGSLASGVYFYRLSAGDFHQTKKMIVLK